MIQRKTFILAALALCIASCGGKGGPGSCSISFSGSFTGTYACTVAATYNLSSNVAVAGIAVNPAGALKSYFFNLRTASGDLHTGTYVSDQINYGDTTLNLTNGQYYGQTSGPSINGTGMFTLKVASLDTAATTNGNKVYLMSGTLDETLVAQAGGATGTVTVHASF
jgi:hypothetical protein